MKPYLVAQIFGGLGNQLFCYAAARRLALVNDTCLRLDKWSGFVRDSYGRQYLLDRFNLPCDIASPRESFMHPGGQVRRHTVLALNRMLPFERRWYVEEKQTGQFDQRLLSLQTVHPVYLSGYWQSERYFADVAPALRTDLTFKGAHSTESVRLAETLDRASAVSVHMRSYREVNYVSALHSPVGIEYYVAAARWMAQQVASPIFYCFSDDVEWARRRLHLPWPVVIVDTNADRGVDGAVDDLWLISQFKHHIVSNSTYSWWGAWLGDRKEGNIVAPRRMSQVTRDYYPKRWHLV